MPKGIPASKPSEQTQRLLEALADIEERLAAERRKDQARVLLVRFVERHGLTAADLREAAKNVAAREVGDAPVLSSHLGRAKRIAFGREIRKARQAKGFSGTQLGKMVGAKSSGAVAMWERGGLPTMSKYRAGLIKHLELPKDFFAEVPTNKRGQHGQQSRGKANGAAA
jgi:DNA-binding transcriptional regulator YiaG